MQRSKHDPRRNNPAEKNDEHLSKHSGRISFASVFDQ